jgi:predicted metal-dependent hydrolase
MKVKDALRQYKKQELIELVCKLTEQKEELLEKNSRYEYFVKWVSRWGSYEKIKQDAKNALR